MPGLKKSATLPTFKTMPGRSGSGSALHRIHSFSELTSTLHQEMAVSAAIKLRRVTSVSVSSAVKNPELPIVVYSIGDVDNFNASDVAQLLVQHRLQGIPVWSTIHRKFIGSVELCDFARVLTAEKSITESKPSFKTWLTYLARPEANERMKRFVLSRPVTSISERSSLLDVLGVLSDADVKRVVLTDPMSGEGVAVISETDVLEYVKRNPNLFTFKDGSEIPVNLGDMKEDEEFAESADDLDSSLLIGPEDTFLDALMKLLDSDNFSLPIVDEKGKLLNTFTMSDLKYFFCITKGRTWNMLILDYLKKCCKKAQYADQLQSCTLGVPLTRIIEAMYVDSAHVIWITDSHGICIGELSISNICAYLCNEKEVLATRRDGLATVSEEAATPVTSGGDGPTIDTKPTELKRVSSGIFRSGGATPDGAAGGSFPDFPRHKSRGVSVDIEASPPAAVSPDVDLGAPGDPSSVAGIEDGTDLIKPIDEDTSSVELLQSTQVKIETAFDFSTRSLDWVSDTGIKNECIMITYPDCFGGNLKGLSFVLDKYLKGVVSGLHILPFYPSSADRGFAPLTYKEVEPTFGGWADLEKIRDEGYDLACDFMVNHISQMSEEFQDFKMRRDESPFADLFIRYKDHFSRSDGEPTPVDLAKIYTRKPRAPYFEIVFEDGQLPETEKVWCTFDFQQIDINVQSEAGKKFIQSQLEYLCKKGIKIIRLDAFGYATKKLDTRCFMEEPEVWDILKWIHSIVSPFGVQLLAEIHEHYSIQLNLSRQCDGIFWVYDFCLPMLLLQAIYDSTARNLHHWLTICPANQFTTLDTHDGIGVVDVKDLMTPEESARTSENLYKYGASVKRIYSSSNYDNLDIYQINCTYYSALGNRDHWYLMARAIQMFTPGIPQVYYVGLLAGVNDIALVETTRVGRDINRHNYTLEELETEVKRPVVQQLFNLCRFRNTYPAFYGTFVLDPLDPSDKRRLRCGWSLDHKLAATSARKKPATGAGAPSDSGSAVATDADVYPSCWLTVDLVKKEFEIKYMDMKTKTETVLDLSVAPDC